VVVAILATCAASEARGQILIQQSRADTPALVRVAPCGLTRGSQMELSIIGERLDGLHDVAGPPGVRLVQVISTEEKLAKVQIEVAADAPLGVFPLHVLCKAGLSNPKLVRVEVLPQAVEQEDNGSLDKATALSLPVCVSGYVTPTDVDYFRFDAAAGQSWVFDVEAGNVGSALRPVLTLYDSQGRELNRTLRRSPDERLVHTFDKAGSYAISVHEAAYQGSEFGTYLLRIGNLPFATSIFPLGGRIGETVAVTFGGGNLAEPLVHHVDLSQRAGTGRERLQAPYADQVVASPMLFEASDLPSAIEQEPNDETAQAATLALPVIVDGRIDRPGDVDHFRFAGRAGERIVIRVAAFQLGSRADLAASILDAAGNELLAVDDLELPPPEAPVVRSINPRLTQEDPLVDFTVPADGEFTLVLSEVSGNGGPEFAYRVELSAPRPRFELVAQPGVALPPVEAQDPNQQDQGQRVTDNFAGDGTAALTIDRGGSGVIIVRALRNDYAGPINLAVEGLPAGVQAAPALLDTGQTDAELTFVADFEAPSTAAFVRIVGTATLDQGELRRVAAQPVIFSSLPGNGEAAQELSVVAVGVSQQGAELAVRCEPVGPIVQGSKVRLTVSIRRREGFSGAVQAAFLRLPLGIAAPELAIAADVSSAELELDVGYEATVGPHSVLLRATMPVEGRPAPVIAAFPLELVIQPPVTLALAEQKLDLVQGGTAKLALHVARAGALVVPIRLSFGGLPQGVTIRQAEIPADATEFELALVAEPGAATSPIRRIVQIRPEAVVGDKVLSLPSLRFALKVARQP
jgi:hypothetical protein